MRKDAGYGASSEGAIESQRLYCSLQTTTTSFLSRLFLGFPHFLQALLVGTTLVGYTPLLESQIPRPTITTRRLTVALFRA